MNQRKSLIIAMALIVIMGVSSCSQQGVDSESSGAVDSVAPSEVSKDAPQGQSRETTTGPVHAVVELDNSTPVLGEPVRIRLTVDSEPDVAVTMPEFGDQLGKYGIADYKSTERVREDGRNEYSQAYTLDLPMSGKLRTPSFLVEFSDNRSGSEQNGKIQELLTEEMDIDVKSVFGAGEVPSKLAPALGELPELKLQEESKSRWPIYGALAVILASIIGAVVWRRKHIKAILVPADEVALAALDALSRREIPSDQPGTDAWYVELSSIVRHYLEGRFSLHAPRLTTEEFFELAKRSEALKPEEKQLIHKLLERADRVKFTDYVPDKAESEQVLADARRFVEETRVVEETREPEGKGAAHV